MACFPRFIPLLFSLLGSPEADLQESAIDCLTEILHKRMDHSAKLKLIQDLNLLPSCSGWADGLPGSEDDDLRLKCAKLLATLCNEIMDCWKGFENSKSLMNILFYRIHTMTTGNT